jgi:phosphoribosylamine---glycine ligase
MKILVVGGGGREHALVRALNRSPQNPEILCAPGNGGIEADARCFPVSADDVEGLVDLAQQEAPDLVVVGPEAPLIAGLADRLTAEGMAVLGPSAAAARLEGSKGFVKDLAHEHGIPTAAYGRFSDAASARAYLAERGAPVVVKADGLAAGKGVIMARTPDEAEAAIDGMFGGRFGAAGQEVVLEEWLEGEEASFFVLTDGETVLPFGTAQDHKRVGEGDTGPNTGGMGAYSPAPILTPEMCETVMARIIQPTLAAMAARGTPYRGILYAGLMLTAEGPKLIEYNVRFGDPEAQVVLPRLKSDLTALFMAAAKGRLKECAPPEWAEETALTVVMAAKGYPGQYRKGSAIQGLTVAESLPGVQIFHAGTARRDGGLFATGGRVLNVTALGADVAEAQARAYAAVDRIGWPEGFCRRDIGWRALAGGRR